MATNTKVNETVPSGQPAKQATESVMFLAIIIGAIVLANVAGHFFFKRFDFTEERLYSLSDGSRRLVGDLDEPMQITAYFTEDLPPPFNATEQYVRNILDEYAAASNGQLQVRFVNPDTDEEREAAEADGIREVQHQVIENDSVSVRTGFRGLVIRYLDGNETIPVIQDTQGLEYDITQKIRLLVSQPMPIGVLSGHEGPTPTKGLAVLRSALPNYELREVDGNNEIDSELRALLIVSPESEVTEPELRRINQYVMNGGSLGVFGSSMKISLQPPAVSAQRSGSGLNNLLSHWGVQLGEDIVADARCGRVPLRTPFGIPIPVAFPPAPVAVFDDEQQAHPVMFRLNQAPLFFTSQVETSDTFEELNGQILSRSSEQSWLLTGDSISLQPRDPREWSMSGESGPFNLVAALEGELPSAFPNAAVSGAEDGSTIQAPESATRPVRVLVAGAGSILRDEFLPQQQGAPQLTGGLALALNAIDWLAQDTDLIAIRAKNIEDPAIDVPQSVQQAEDEALGAAEEGNSEEAEAALARRTEAIEAWDERKAMYRWSLTFGPALFLGLIGLGRWQVRRRRSESFSDARRKAGTSNPTKEG